MSGILVAPYAFVRRASAPAKWRALRFVIAPWCYLWLLSPLGLAERGDQRLRFRIQPLLCCLIATRFLKFHTCHCADVIEGLQSRLGDGMFK